MVWLDRWRGLKSLCARWLSVLVGVARGGPAVGRGGPERWRGLEPLEPRVLLSATVFEPGPFEPATGSSPPAVELLEPMDGDGPDAPAVDWSSYLGGANWEWGGAVAVDAAGNVFVAGSTSSSEWVEGGHDTTFNYEGDAGFEGEGDAFVVKLDAAGEHVWSTYLGGAEADWAHAIALDSDGNVLIAGKTSSPDWAENGHDTEYNGGDDAFVVKLAGSGEHLWSTYLGGDALDAAHGVAVDADGNVLVTGLTASQGWTSGGHATELVGPVDAFAVKLSAAGDHLWSTYLGGTGLDRAHGIAVDTAGHVLVAGATESSGWTSGGHDTSFNGEQDAFLVKLDADGDHAWSTYLGGASADAAHAITIDAQDRVLVTGLTESAGWTSGGHDSSFNGERDAFVAALDADGDHAWSTYLGGDGWESGEGIAVDADGEAVYITGRTTSAGWVDGGFDTDRNGPEDAFIAKLDAGGAHLWSSYLGGSEWDAALGAAVGPDGVLVVTGETESSGWVDGGHDTTRNGPQDVFVARLEPTAPPIDPTNVLTVTLDYTYDTHGFFDDPDRRDLLQLAADMVAGQLVDDLAAIEPSGSNTWEARFTHPGTGDQVELPDPVIGERELLVFAGGRPLDGPIGTGGPGGWWWSGTSEWGELVETRGQQGAVERPFTDFGPWGGTVSFDTETDWHFGESTDGLVSGVYDFLSVAIHEIIHMLGFTYRLDGNGDPFNSFSEWVDVDEAVFTGPRATEVHEGDGHPPLAGGGDYAHWDDDVTHGGQVPVMVASIPTGTRHALTALDLAALEDIGWELLAPPEAQLVVDDLLEPGHASHDFTVIYQSETNLDVATIIDNDEAIRVTGPEDFDALARFVGIDAESDGPVREVTYAIDAPNDAWSEADDGTYTVHVEPAQVADVTGRFVLAEALGTFEMFVDNTPPVSTAALAGDAGEDAWFVSPVDVALDATDERSGVDRIEYRIDDGDWQVYSEAFTIDAEGVTTLRHRAVDQVGNVEDTQSVELHIDTVAPTSTASLAGPVGEDPWFIGPVEVTLDASDATSGVTRIEYRIETGDNGGDNGGDNNGDWTLYDEPFTVDAEGIAHLEHRAVDEAGLAEAAQAMDVHIDTTPPTAALTDADDLVIGGDEPYTFTVTYSDNLELAVDTIIDNDEAIHVTGPNSFDDFARFVAIGAPDAGVECVVTYALDAPADGWSTDHNGVYDIILRDEQIADAAGHHAAAGTLGEFTIDVDTVPPTSSHELDGEAGNAPWFVGPVTVTLLASDEHSGVDRIEYRIGDGDWQTYDDDERITIEADGVTELHHRAIDLAGNVEQPQLVEIHLDTTPPTAAIAAADDVLLATQDPHEIAITFTDNIELDAATIDGNDAAVRVTGPDGFGVLAAFVALETSEGGAQGDATFHVDAPPGGWAARHNGEYTIALEPAQVADVAGNEVESGALGTFVVDVPSIVLDRLVFYNHSAFDGRDAGHGAHNDGAVAPDKQALLPGGTAGFANYTSYTRGLNGVMIDLDVVADPAAIDASDFELLVGTDGDIEQWLTAPEPSVHVREVDDRHRVELIWADGAIVNTWLRVTLRAAEATGLADDDVFYFGNAIGATGDGAGQPTSDIDAIRANQTGFDAASIDSPYDIDRDGRVDLADLIQARNNAAAAGVLELIQPPANAGSPPPDPSPMYATGAAHDPSVGLDGMLVRLRDHAGSRGFDALAAADLALHDDATRAWFNVLGAADDDAPFPLL